MPRSPAKRMRRRARRAARRVRRKAQSTTLVNHSLQPIPNRYICKMKYAESITTSASGQFQFRLNSLFDPNSSGVGHQPYGFDNLALLYNRYRVISCGWRIQGPSSSTGSPFIVGCMPSNDTAITWADYGEMAENPRTKYVTNNPGAPVATLTGKSYLPRLMGRTRAQYMADDNYQAIVTTNPNENAILYLATFSATTGVALPSIALNVVLEYTVEFFDVKHVVQS